MMSVTGNFHQLTDEAIIGAVSPVQNKSARENALLASSLVGVLISHAAAQDNDGFPQATLQALLPGRPSHQTQTPPDLACSTRILITMEFRPRHS